MAEILYDTVLEYIYHWEKEAPDDVFLRQPFGSTWEEYTWSDVGQMARKVATYIESLGLPPKSHIGLISKNCREWIITDIAIMMSGHVSVPLYPTLNADELRTVLEIGDVKALFIGKLETWEHMEAGIDGMDLKLAAFPHYKGCSKVSQGTPWADIMANHAPKADNHVPDMDDLWTIVFTSGTTGVPKGVMLSYRLLKNVGDISRKSNFLKCEERNNRFFSYLPLNHIAERAAVEVQCLTWGGSMSFAENLDTFADNLRGTRPTTFFGVPRIYTKFKMGVLAAMPQKKLSRLLSIPIVSGLVKKKIQKTLGLDQSRVNIVGAAPTTQEDKKWWKALGLPMSEGYGMTENLAICTWLEADDETPGALGKLQPGCEAKIDPNTGELCMRAPWVMLGYYNNEEKTNEALRDGWLHTGDRARMDDNGYIYLTGRVKDMFKTAKGKYIVPAPLETCFAGNANIEQICIAGLGLEQPKALIVLSEIGQAASRDEVEDSILSCIASANSDGGGYKHINQAIIVKEPWSVENGILTPTLKIKRGKIDEVYLAKMRDWEKTGEKVVWEA